MHAQQRRESPGLSFVSKMSHSTMRRINIDHALHSPSKEQLTTLLSTLCSDGRLWKFGSCFEDLLDSRPFTKTHYNPTWFDTKDAMCVAYGITTKELAAALETAGLRYLKHTPGVSKLGLYMDYVSLPQRPRRAAEEVAFAAALKVELLLYASVAGYIRPSVCPFAFPLVLICHVSPNQNLWF